MSSSQATTVAAYLKELPPDRAEAISAVRDVIVANLPEGFVETMTWGMITYEVPLEVYPDTYNKKPLMYAALANQKRHMAVYLTAVYADEATLDRFRERYLETGRKLDMGKSCVRFSKLENLPLEVIGEAIAENTLDEFLAVYEASRS